MLSQFTKLFKSSKESPEQLFFKENQWVFDTEKGIILKGMVLNELGFRLEYFSNRKLDHFNNLAKLFEIAPQINEKIDLEIHSQRFVARLGNTEENLKEFKQIIKTLNDYYVKFEREK